MLTGNVTANLDDNAENIGEIIISSRVVKNGYNSHEVFTVQKSGVIHTGGTSGSHDNMKSGTVVLTARGCEFLGTISR